jgi:hypothetical protein
MGNTLYFYSQKPYLRDQLTDIWASAMSYPQKLKIFGSIEEALVWDHGLERGSSDDEFLVFDDEIEVDGKEWENIDGCHLGLTLVQTCGDAEVKDCRFETVGARG